MKKQGLPINSKSNTEVAAIGRLRTRKAGSRPLGASNTRIVKAARIEAINTP